MALFGNKKAAVPEIPSNPVPKNNTPAELPTPQPSITQKEPAPLPAPTQSFNAYDSKPQEQQVMFPTQSQESIPQVTRELTAHKNSPLSNDGEQPFFVRIDKFTETRENFKNVNLKVQEMEQILENLEKIKEEEDKELDNWKEEIDEMKSYLNDIDKEIFSKI